MSVVGCRSPSPSNPEDTALLLLRYFERHSKHSYQYGRFTMTSSVSISPKQTWLTVFLPALLYYTIYSPSTTPILSYLNLQPSYTSLNTTINRQKGAKHEIFYEGSNFETVIEDDFASFFDMVWVEDAELGRGYLLLSDSASSGKVWRFETGKLKVIQ